MTDGSASFSTVDTPMAITIPFNLNPHMTLSKYYPSMHILLILWMQPWD